MSLPEIWRKGGPRVSRTRSLRVSVWFIWYFLSQPLGRTSMLQQGKPVTGDPSNSLERSHGEITCHSPRKCLKGFAALGKWEIMACGKSRFVM